MRYAHVEADFSDVSEMGAVALGSGLLLHHCGRTGPAHASG